MVSTSNFEHALADEIDLLTGRVANLSAADILHSILPNMPCMPPQHPLTPPEYLHQYCGIGGLRLNQHQFAVGSQGFPVAETGVYEINVDPYGRKMMPSFVPVSQQGYQRPQPQPNYAGLPPPGITHPNSQFYAGHQTYRRVETTIVQEESYARRIRQEPRPQERPAVEEKPTGGVSVHLDYDMDEMTEFVGAYAQRLVLCNETPVGERLLPSYRKFVYQILSSTRLPSSTILHGLLYLRERMDMLGHTQSLGQDNVYRLLTTCLLLASKFLDDNTFQNKSWSEVTNIQVRELNELEKKWLEDINWNLHIDPEGNKGFTQLRNLWEAFRNQNSAKAVVAPVLAPIKTNTRSRPQSTFSPLYPLPPQNFIHTSPQFTASSERSVQLPPVRTQHDDPSWWSPQQYSPPSAPHTGPATPEGYYGWSAPLYAPSGQQPQQLPPIALTGYAQQPWHHHPHGSFNCGYCRPNSEGFFLGNYVPPIAA